MKEPNNLHAARFNGCRKRFIFYQVSANWYYFAVCGSNLSVKYSRAI